MTEPILKPCPFCGKQPYVAEEIDPDDWWYVACKTPGCILPCAGGHTSIESAIAKWNRRTTPDRDSIIEQCAKVCEGDGDGFETPDTWDYYARAIRALKTGPNGEQS
ncbi:Lar family restriction alleviation protein [Burkholderia metallica]|uniref:Lar family restriction alleviation protein n=1 Tax=Burkholderia metallica TaxID=488729 RepID=UPI001CF50011|nr:Lar family restriction alleviation protein [Burkholderia metallica]MCA8018117.1 Lar family restriction alleviation protein [Burkholderia metallica]